MDAQVEELASRNQALTAHVNELTTIKIELHAAYIRIENKLREIAAELEGKKAENAQLQTQITNAANPPVDPSKPAIPTDPNAPATPNDPAAPATPAPATPVIPPAAPADPTTPPTTNTPTDTNTPTTPALSDPNVPTGSTDAASPNGNPDETNATG